MTLTTRDSYDENQELHSKFMLGLLPTIIESVHEAKRA